MARNCEKHFVGLNRIYLEEQWKKEEEKKRPSLHTLQTAADVKKWIPSIKREIDYCLQLSGARKHDYSEVKFKEFEERVQYLEREHKRFIKKVFELDPNTKDVPWKAKSYRKKIRLNENKDMTEVPSSKQKVIPVCLALLDDNEIISDEEEEDFSIDKDEVPKNVTDLCDSTKSKQKPRSACNEQTNRDITMENKRKMNNASLVAYDSSDSDET